MRDSQLDVTHLDTETLRNRRETLRLSKAETARRMCEQIVSGSPASREDVALTPSGLGWASEPACRRAIDDLELGRRYGKEEQYVDALLAVLDLSRSDVGLY